MTRRSPRGFRYPLEALRTKYGWELNLVKLELASANAEVARQENALRDADTRLDDAMTDWKQRLGERKQFDAHAQRLVNVYLGQLRETCDTQRQNLQNAQQARDEVMARLLEAQRAVDRVETHRDDALATFGREAATRAYRAADDDVVQRYGVKEAQP